MIALLIAVLVSRVFVMASAIKGRKGLPVQTVNNLFFLEFSHQVRGVINEIILPISPIIHIPYKQSVVPFLVNHFVSPFNPQDACL